MEDINKKKVDIILSFNDEELESWMKSRLHGDDKYFPIYLGHDLYLSGFLSSGYYTVFKNKKQTVDGPIK